MPAIETLLFREAGWEDFTALAAGGFVLTGRCPAAFFGEEPRGSFLDFVFFIQLCLPLRSVGGSRRQRSATVARILNPLRYNKMASPPSSNGIPSRIVAGPKLVTGLD